MTKIEMIKLATSTVVGIGTAKIVQSIALNNTSTEKLTDKVTVHAGAYVMGMMVADITKRYTDTKIDEVAHWYNENIKKNN